jgi:hypothetical protein
MQAGRTAFGLFRSSGLAPLPAEDTIEAWSYFLRDPGAESGTATMKYFTPDRYFRLGNLEDERAFLAAHEAWEQAIAGYRQHLQQIRGRLPGGLRRLVETVYLHDARVVDMVLATRGRFIITLQPESLPSHRVVLSYSLLEPPTIDWDALPESARSEPLEWLYDELDVEQGEPAAFRHDILLSNGSEVRLRFHTVSVTRPQPLNRVATSTRSS